jgi:hypothetical protein
MTQPVLYRFGDVSVPILLMIGEKDTTAVGKDLAPPELRPKLGNYPELGKAAAKAIPAASSSNFLTSATRRGRDYLAAIERDSHRLEPHQFGQIQDLLRRVGHRY